jgi:uncharacterized caspase-like protein
MIKAAMAGGAAVLCPWPGVFAQSGAGLLRAPKQALVIGNSKYKQTPLKNPVNDAQGMAGVLKSAGFGVTLGLDLTQAGIRDAIRAYSENLAKTKAVGLFYFAGHGAQLAWRNYLIPVDADIVNTEELRERGVDVNSLIEGIKRAGNPMNLIILDACRDNPFGGNSRVDQKGLSQLDAPAGTLLAYATAPGNTAIDGEGANGLYTEHLLREIKVPEAKVEDVFKRVRLGVRRRSNGLQIPWESTSLEEDFWFIPPRAVKELADHEIEQERTAELALWERIQAASKPEPLEDYLRRYPSGRYTELAQLQLDRVLANMGEKKVEVVSAPGNPYTKGTSRTDTAYRIGDEWTYHRIDLVTKEESKPRWVVTGITDTEVIYNNGRRVTDLLGNALQRGGGADWGPNQTVPTEFAVGKRWNSHFNFTTAKGRGSMLDLELRIVDKERITLPAGTFDAFRIEASGRAIGEARRRGKGINANRDWDWKRWYAPEQVRQHVAWELSMRNSAGQIINSHREELVSFKQR